MGHRVLRLFRDVAAAVVIALVVYYGICALLLVAYTTVIPPTTGVQLQRRVEALFEEGDYAKRYRPVAPEEIAPTLRHAAVAAEDTRFYEHTGIDWEAVREAVEDNIERGRVYRGGSTITQQLVKNLFMTTHSSFVRKALEAPLTYLAELILSKDRILTLYLNVIEWGPGLYGAEAAAQHYYGRSAAGLSRYQAAALAAVIPNPLERSPHAMGWYTNIILRRMSNLYPGGRPAPPPAPEPPPADTADTARAAADRPPRPAVEPLEAAPPTTDSTAEETIQNLSPRRRGSQPNIQN